jgi:hypothetical protein
MRRYQCDEYGYKKEYRPMIKKAQYDTDGNRIEYAVPWENCGCGCNKVYNVYEKEGFYIACAFCGDYRAKMTPRKGTDPLKEGIWKEVEERPVPDKSYDVVVVEKEYCEGITDYESQKMIRMLRFNGNAADEKYREFLPVYFQSEFGHIVGYMTHLASQELGSDFNFTGLREELLKTARNIEAECIGNCWSRHGDFNGISYILFSGPDILLNE